MSRGHKEESDSKDDLRSETERLWKLEKGAVWGTIRGVGSLDFGETWNVNPLSERVSRECSRSRLNGQQLRYVFIVICCVYLLRSRCLIIYYFLKKLFFTTVQ